MKIGRLFLLVFFLFCFFPYIVIFHSISDVQPYALLVSLIVFPFLIISGFKIKKEINYLLVPFFLSFFFLMVCREKIAGLRSFADYSSLYLIAAVSYYFILKDEKYFFGVLKFSIMTWFFVGLIQVISDKNIFVSFLPRGAGMVGEGGRGVIGLAPEATFYGLECMLMFFLTYLFLDKWKNLFLILLIIQIFLFSKSSLCFFIFFISFFIYFIFRLKLNNIFLYIFIPFLLYKFFGNMMELYISKIPGNSRMVFLAKMALSSPGIVLRSDASGNQRMSHIYFSFKGFFENYMFPNGFESWGRYYDRNFFSKSNNFFWWYTGTPTRIMSGYGSALYELGFFGFFVIFSVNSSLHKFLKYQKNKFFLSAVFLNLILISAVPLATPLVGVVVGACLAKCKIRDREIRELPVDRAAVSATG